MRFLSLLPVRLCLLAVSFVLIAIGLGSIASAAGGNGAIIGSGGAQLFVLLVVIFAHVFRFPTVNWSGSLRKGIGFGLVTIVVAIAVQMGFEALGSLLGLGIVEQPMVRILRVSNGANLASLILMAGLIAPVIEEVYFRFWWFDWIGRKTSLLTAAVLTSLMFAAMHGSIWLVPGIFTAGMFFAFARVRWGVGTAIACHSVFNLFTILAIMGGWA